MRVRLQFQDEPWKDIENPGDVEGSWGLFDKE